MKYHFHLDQKLGRSCIHSSIYHLDHILDRLFLYTSVDPKQIEHKYSIRAMEDKWETNGEQTGNHPANGRQVEGDLEHSSKYHYVPGFKSLRSLRYLRNSVPKLDNGNWIEIIPRSAN